MEQSRLSGWIPRVRNGIGEFHIFPQKRVDFEFYAEVFVDFCGFRQPNVLSVDLVACIRNGWISTFRQIERSKVPESVCRVFSSYVWECNKIQFSCSWLVFTYCW